MIWVSDHNLYDLIYDSVMIQVANRDSYRCDSYQLHVFSQVASCSIAYLYKS